MLVQVLKPLDLRGPGENERRSIMHKHPVLRSQQNADARSQHIADKLIVLQKHATSCRRCGKHSAVWSTPVPNKCLGECDCKMKASSSDPDLQGPEVKNKSCSFVFLTVQDGSSI